MIRFDQQHGEDRDQQVRVAINPSILQRFCGNGYYFYDDIPVPYRTVLNEERLLLPSHQEALMADDIFGALWIRCCVRLAKHQAELQHKFRMESWILGISWTLVLACVIIVVTGDYVGSLEELLGLLMMLPFLGIVPLSLPPGLVEGHLARLIRGDQSDHYQAIQELVDELAPLFSEQGFHVDYVPDKRQFYPDLIYLRFARSNRAKSSTSDTKLAHSMADVQRKAREAHQEALLEQRQNEAKKSQSSSTVACSVPVETVRSFRPVIILLTIPLVFLLLFLHVSQLTIMFDVFEDSPIPMYVEEILLDYAKLKPYDSHD